MLDWIKRARGLMHFGFDAQGVDVLRTPEAVCCSEFGTQLLELEDNPQYARAARAGGILLCRPIRGLYEVRYPALTIYTSLVKNGQRVHHRLPLALLVRNIATYNTAVNFHIDVSNVSILW